MTKLITQKDSKLILVRLKKIQDFLEQFEWDERYNVYRRKMA